MFEPNLVEAGEIVKNAAARRFIDAVGVGEKEDRIADGAELDALILRRQKPTAPQAIIERLIGEIARALRDHDDEGRQIAILAAQAVGKPGPHARPAR